MLGVVVLLLIMSPYIVWNVYAGLGARRRDRSLSPEDPYDEFTCAIECGIQELAGR